MFKTNEVDTLNQSVYYEFKQKNRNTVLSIRNLHAPQQTNSDSEEAVKS